jgi:two-component system invasion response regulator UvrY
MRILIADDDQRYRSFLRRIVERERGVRVIGEAIDAEEAVELAKKLKPDLVLIDIDLPGKYGLEATRQIREELPMARVIMFSGIEGEAYRNAARQSGANDFLLKNAEIPKILSAIHRWPPPKAA